MPRVAEKTITPEKISMFKDYDSVLQRMVEASKKEILELQKTAQTLTIRNSQLNEEITRKQNQFEQWKRLEEQKVQDAKFKINNEVITREKKLEVGELDLTRRLEEVAKREAKGKRIVEREQKLINDRIDIEKLRVSATNLMDDANRKMSEATKFFNEASRLNDEAKKKEVKANSVNEASVMRENAIKEREKDIALRAKNLEELKKVVDPKILEIKEREDRLEKKEKELAQKEQDVTSKINEEKVFLASLQEREHKVKENEKKLLQRDEEVTRKALMSGIKNA